MKRGQDIVNAQNGVNDLPDVDFNNSSRELLDALSDCMPSAPAPSGVANYGSTNEVKQALDINVLSRANCFVCTGGGNAYILTTDTAFQLRKLSYYYKYSRINFIATFTNTGACTVKVDDGAVVALETASGALTANQIVLGNEYTLEYNGTKWIVKNPSGGVYFKQQIILSNNITDPNNDIDFSAGNFVFHDNTGFANLSAITKRLDANFAIGNNQGGLDTGTKQINTWYYSYAIYNPTTTVSDVVFSASNISPTLPSGFTKYKYIGALRTNASGNILPATWLSNGYCRYASLINDRIGNPTTTGTLYNVTVPLIPVIADIDYFADPSGGGAYYGLVTSPFDSNNVPSLTNFNAEVEFTNENRTKRGFLIPTNTSQIRTRWTGNTDITERIFTKGYYDLNL